MPALLPEPELDAPMNTTAHLQELLDQLHDGQTGARDALLEQSLGRVRILAQKMFRRQSDLRALDETDDVASKAMLRLHRSLEEVKPPNVRALLGLAAQHIRWVLNDLAREKANHSCLSYGPRTPEPQPSTEGPTGFLEWAEFHEKVEALPDQEREIFDALFYQGLEQAEASELLGIPLRTLKRRWREARVRLVDAMQGRMPGDAL